MINFTFVEFLNLNRVFVNSSLISGSKDKCPLSVNTFKKDFNVTVNPGKMFKITFNFCCSAYVGFLKKSFNFFEDNNVERINDNSSPII